MKKIKIGILVLGILGSCGLARSYDAAEYQPDGRSSLSKEATAVSNLENSDSVVVMEDGSVIHGEVEITNVSNPSDKIVVNTDTDPMAVTVQEYKEDPSSVETKEFPNQLKMARAATPPGYSVGLSPRSSYSSRAFSAKGWRFAERNYYATGNNGPYLRWQTFVDSGVVGSTLAARNTYQYGRAYGSIIYPGSYSYIQGLATYYTYNPIPGTWFYVANI